MPSRILKQVQFGHVETGITLLVDVIEYFATYTNSGDLTVHEFPTSFDMKTTTGQPLIENSDGYFLFTEVNMIRLERLDSPMSLTAEIDRLLNERRNKCPSIDV